MLRVALSQSRIHILLIARVYFQNEIIQVPCIDACCTADDFLQQTLDTQQAIGTGHDLTQFCRSGYAVRCTEPRVPATDLIREGEQILKSSKYRVFSISHNAQIRYFTQWSEDFDGTLVSFVMYPPHTLQEIIPQFAGREQPLHSQAFSTWSEVLGYCYEPPGALEKICWNGTWWDVCICAVPWRCVTDDLFVPNESTDFLGPDYEDRCCSCAQTRL